MSTTSAAAHVDALRCGSLPISLGGWQLRHDRKHYDWSSGWLMRARYNCQEDSRQPPAAAWVHLPYRNSNKTWNDIVQEHGGHLKVAERAVPNSPFCNRTMRKGIHVLILGDSYLRQVFEAFANRFRKHVTAGAVNTASPPILSMTRPKRVSVANFSFLRWPSRPTVLPGCHGFNISAFYKASSPFSLQRCEDNLAWLEFNDSLRLYFVFRPYAFSEDLRVVLQRLADVKLEDMDFLVCNDRCGGLGDRIRRSFLASCPTRRADRYAIAFDPVRAIIRSQLHTTARSSYGATNGMRTNDAHACMPGIPDDEVDILFAAIARGSCTFS
mmetsp:Transcript_26475/g.67248  ORF Transcript_26475/g.67248 Transcript_26475/m.67248 type:complete len:327 (+) Transcript_26475:238-1218(+)